MSLALLENLGLPIINAVSDVLKRILPPEKMSESERAVLEAEMQKAIMTMDWQYAESEIEDRVSARALAQADVAKGNAFTNILAAIHRPLWSLVSLAIFVLTVVDQWVGLAPVELSPIQADIMRTVLMFYFGGRTLEKGAQTLATYKNGKNGNGSEPKPAPAPQPKPTAPIAPLKPKPAPER